MYIQKHSRRLLRYIRKNFDYTSYVAEHFSTQDTHSDEMRICCPKCMENEYKCYINDEKKKFICFKCDFCNRNSDVFDFVSATEGISRSAAITRLASEFREVTPDQLEWDDIEDAPIEETPQRSFLQAKPIEAMPSGAKLLTEENEETAPFLAYLYGRGLTLDEITAMSTYYIPEAVHFVFKKGKLAGNIGRRVLWPVYGGQHALVSWLARLIGPGRSAKTPKFINCPESDMAMTVWPFSPPPTSCRKVVLVEGVLDALAVRRTGYYSYATFGKKLSEEQISLFKYWEVEEVTVFMDLNAKREIKQAVNTLRLRFNRVNVVDNYAWPEDMDSGKCLESAEKIAMLKDVLDKRINVQDEIEFAKWSLKTPRKEIVHASFTSTV